MELRRLTERDAEAWWHIRLEALENEPFAFGKAAEEHRATSIETIAPRFSETGADNFTLGAFADRELSGIATFAREAGVKERHKAHIYGVYVAPSQRRKGIGRALIMALIERAKQDSSIEQILLAVAVGQDAARHLYRGCGFISYGVEPNALKVGSNYIDEDQMILRLTQPAGVPVFPREPRG